MISKALLRASSLLCYEDPSVEKNNAVGDVVVDQFLFSYEVTWKYSLAMFIFLQWHWLCMLDPTNFFLLPCLLSNQQITSIHLV